jgi:uncharacterized protein (DUF305 family)
VSPRAPGPRQANDADRRYVEQVLPRIRAATAMSGLAVRSSDPGIRRMARLSTSTERARERSVVALVSSWRRPDPVQEDPGPTPSVSAPDAVESLADAAATEPGAVGRDRDRRFLEQLRAHAVASMASARREMVEGLDRQSRTVAQESIRTHSRELAAIDAFTFAPVDAPRTAAGGSDG